MRRLAPALAALALVLAGCGGAEEVAPLPQDVQGTVAQEEPPPKGDPAQGRSVYAAQGCGSCHIFEPAGSNGRVGPNLDELPQLARDAERGTLEEFTRESIVEPNAYVEEGFPATMPAFDQLSDKELSDLVAFLTARR